MRYIFWIGIVMIAYDFMGHFLTALARITGETGVYLWNTYSKFIWPSITNSLTYDLYWSVFFIIAIFFLIFGYSHK